ncbi:hypothetical protein EUX98_g3821 [Antrodiella citrinella]|uniref:Uncharacterized protein n=1 Tax=Antrodiella citrinella TaxID=2447956 RepID=A0A4S4MVJ9_9APHY|nr:hypothetical protein EUX98_g3821 [Antrodiella citrinella]
MPSLRRTLSSPSVRLSPYSNPSSSSTINQANRQQGGGHGPRRSLGSETGGRRVLADIDWWTVHAGQMFTPGHVSPSQVQDTEDDDQAEQEPPVNTITLAAAVPEDEFIAPNTLWHTALPGSGIGAFTELAQVPYAFAGLVSPGPLLSFVYRGPYAKRASLHRVFKLVRGELPYVYCILFIPDGGLGLLRHHVIVDLQLRFRCGSS